jgi:hypothetical protein
MTWKKSLSGQENVMVRQCDGATIRRYANSISLPLPPAWPYPPELWCTPKYLMKKVCCHALMYFSPERAGDVSEGYSPSILRQKDWGKP